MIQRFFHHLTKRQRPQLEIDLEIALVSFVILFLELLVIRLLGTEIRIFAYLSNLILLATFVGSGLGMIIKPTVRVLWSVVAVAVVVFLLVTDYIVRLPRLEFRLFRGITELMAPLSESYIWLQLETYSKTGLVIGTLLTLGVFFLVVVMFVPLGQYLGRFLNQSRQPLRSYSVNIAASLAGMWTFSWLSWAGVSPYVGLVLVMAVLVARIGERQLRIYGVIALVASIGLLLPREAKQPYEAPVTFWSPYQKLTLSLIETEPLKPYRAEGWYLEVNNVGYMGLLDLSAEGLEKRRATIEAHFEDAEGLLMANQYQVPYRFAPHAEKVLIIGGGAGNDAAAAIRNQSQAIDLVEIDPTIVSLGKKYHPEKPYQDPRVRVEVNDGRAFLERGEEEYDLVVMGLADSHTTSSAATNVQLDNYLYTRESLTKVRERLSDQGVLVLSFEVTRPWIGERIQETMTRVFGYPPLVFDVRSDGAFGWGGYFFVIAKDRPVLGSVLGDNPELAAFVDTHRVEFDNPGIRLLSDDWPYLYLDQPRIPRLHILLALIISSILWAGKKYVVGSKRVDVRFFALGAGFMVYEFQNISKASLLFGNTWMTNMYIITGVMVFILAANWLASKGWFSRTQIGIGLLLALLLQLAVPYSGFNQLDGWSKLTASLLFLNLPHLFSGLLFAELFKTSRDRGAAFGSNLLGSAIGGFFQFFSYLWGMSSLLVVTMIFYSIGIAWRRK